MHGDIQRAKTKQFKSFPSRKSLEYETKLNLSFNKIRTKLKLIQFWMDFYI